VIKALIFDFDGLILDTESSIVEGWKEIYAEFGQEFPLQTWIRDVIGTTDAAFDPANHLAAVTGRSLDLRTRRALHARVERYHLEQLRTLSAMPGVVDYLETGRRLGLRLAVVSSSGHAWVEGHLRQLDLLELFDAILCREDVRQIKPDPELFLAALECLQVPAEQALAFEDSRNGVLAARRAGLRVVAVPNQITAQGAFEGTSLVLASLADLPLEDLLKQIDLEIRKETEADIPGIRLVEQQAFQRPAEADLVDLCRTNANVSLSLVAARAGSITGHILFTPVTLEPLRDTLRGLGLGPIAVLPECQRTGIGSRLMWAGLEFCRAQGYDFVVLLGDPRYYSRFGFNPGRNFGLSSDYGDGDEFQVLELRPGVLAGATGRIKYIPEFNEMEC
jgi:HAD superfamily hydrolase (TIGR01509 family)